MRIQEAAETLGLTTETLRYYERVGLIGSVARSEGGQRNYTDEELEEISKITVLRRGGISVEDLTKIKLLLKESDEDEALRILTEKFYRFSDYLGTTSQMSELLGISSISGILRFGRYPAYHGISEPHLAVKSSKSVVENRPYY